MNATGKGGNMSKAKRNIRAEKFKHWHEKMHAISIQLKEGKTHKDSQTKAGKSG